MPLLPPWCRPAPPDGAFLDVVVQPRASREGLGPVVGDRLKVRVHAPAADNAANDAVTAVVARSLGLPRSAVSLAAGRTGRRKTLRLAGLDAERAARVLLPLLESS